MFQFSQIKNDIILPVLHRGASLKAPENTMAAFEIAHQLHTPVIELDFSCSKDGKLAVIHDATVNRTTDGTGAVLDKTWSELQKLDAGSWFSDQYRDERVPLLDDVLDWAIEKNIGLVIEAKQFREHRLLVDAILALYKRQPKLLDQVLLLSFNHSLINQVKLAEPKFRLECVTIARYHKQLDAILSSNPSSVSVEYPYFHLDDGIAYKTANLSTRLYLPEDKIRNNPIQKLSESCGFNVEDDILNMMKKGVVDMICYDDMDYMKQLIEKSGKKWK